MATVENLLSFPGIQRRQQGDCQDTSRPQAAWSNLEKMSFRFFFLYFLLQALPLDWKYWRHLFAIDWLHLHLRDLFHLSRYTPQFLASYQAAGSWGLGTFADWGLAAGLALAGALLWSYRDKNHRQYRQLYYWLRVLLRYRLAIGLFAYGFLKLFPMQAPLPSLGTLNTAYGDFNAWKLFSMSLGIAPNYESFLGLVEIAAAALLLHRKTAFLGAFIILAFTGNVFVSNLAYEGGEQVYSLYLVLMALFILAYDLPRLLTLLVREQPALPNRFHPAFPGWQQKARTGLKVAGIFFVLLYGYKSFAAYHQAPYQFPQTPGLAQASGLYQVSEFRLNNKVLPYSETNPDRWQDVVFEEWATLSIRSLRPAIVEVANQEEIYLNDAQRNYEVAGTSGRHYYGYRLDAANQVLYLQHKNKHHRTEKITLHYERPTDSRIILSGQNEKHDQLYVVLDKLPKKYLLQEAAGRGRRQALKL